MATSDPNLRVCLKRNRMVINRGAIKSLGNPTHLRFRYDDSKGVLFITPTDPSDLDAFKIPQYYWNDSNQQCDIARIALLRALQRHLGWMEGSKHFFWGTAAKIDGKPTLAYVLTENVRYPWERAFPRKHKTV